MQKTIKNTLFVHNKWVDDNGPMFTCFRSRIEILSRGTLPPKQTVDGFYAGESVPVNEALSKIFIQLHITEHTGRGIPQITSVYGRDKQVQNLYLWGKWAFHVMYTYWGASEILNIMPIYTKK